MKKIKHLLILFTALFCQTVFAQSRQADSSKWSFGISLAYGNNFRKITSTNSALFNGQNSKTIQDTVDKPKTTFGFSVKCFYRIYKNINLYTGFDFTDKGYKTRKYVLTNYYIIYNHPYGPNDTSITTAIRQDNYSYFYLSIPLGVNYKIGKNNFYFILGASVNIDILLQQNDNVYFGDSNDYPIAYYYSDWFHCPPNDVTISGTINGSFCLNIYHASLFLQPFYTSSLTSPKNNTIVGSPKLYLYTYGVSLGVLFK